MLSRAAAVGHVATGDRDIERPGVFVAATPGDVVDVPGDGDRTALVRLLGLDGVLEVRARRGRVRRGVVRTRGPGLGLAVGVEVLRRHDDRVGASAVAVNVHPVAVMGSSSSLVSQV